MEGEIGEANGKNTPGAKGMEIEPSAIYVGGG
jgi:hypothetical protein